MSRQPDRYLHAGRQSELQGRNSSSNNPRLKEIQFNNRFTKMTLSTDSLLLEPTDGFKQFFTRNWRNSLNCWQKQIDLERRQYPASDIKREVPTNVKTPSPIRGALNKYCISYLKREKCSDECTALHRYPYQDGVSCPLDKSNQCKDGKLCIYLHSNSSPADTNSHSSTRTSLEDRVDKVREIIQKQHEAKLREREAEEEREKQSKYELQKKLEEDRMAEEKRQKEAKEKLAKEEMEKEKLKKEKTRLNQIKKKSSNENKEENLHKNINSVELYPDTVIKEEKIEECEMSTYNFPQTMETNIQITSNVETSKCVTPDYDACDLRNKRQLSPSDVILHPPKAIKLEKESPDKIKSEPKDLFDIDEDNLNLGSCLETKDSKELLSCLNKEHAVAVPNYYESLDSSAIKEINYFVKNAMKLINPALVEQCAESSDLLTEYLKSKDIATICQQCNDSAVCFDVSLRLFHATILKHISCQDLLNNVTQYLSDHKREITLEELGEHIFGIKSEKK